MKTEDILLNRLIFLFLIVLKIFIFLGRLEELL